MIDYRRLRIILTATKEAENKKRNGEEYDSDNSDRNNHRAREGNVH